MTPGETTSPAEIVLWPLALERDILDLPFGHDARCLRTVRGLLVLSTPRVDATFPRAARRFCATGNRIWAEVTADRVVIGEEPSPDSAWLITRSGDVWSIDDPNRWPTLGDILDWNTTVASVDRPLPSWRLRLTAVQARAPVSGILCRAGRGSRVACHLLEFTDVELRDFRFARMGKLWWLFAPRGLPQGFPIAGRALRNIGSRVEPILLPRNRRPVPVLSRSSLRRALSAEEGDVVIWWDSRRGEHCTIARRSQSHVLDRATVLETDW